jgi:Family of unknown function (DUF6163)
MTLVRYSGEASPPLERGAAIRVGESQASQREQTRWGTILVIFMRMIAALWICQGLSEWTKVLLPGESFLTTLPSNAAAAAVIFFAIADLLAAVGLWLATPWGGALWLFAASLQIFVVVALPNFYSSFWAVLDVVLILLYFVLTWRAGHATEKFMRSR